MSAVCWDGLRETQLGGKEGKGKRLRRLWRYRILVPVQWASRTGKRVLCVFRKVWSCSQDGWDSCWVGVCAWVRWCLAGWWWWQGKPCASTAALAALLANHPAVQHWAGDSPLLGCIGKPSEKKISGIDFERKQLVIQYIGNWWKIRLLP